MTDKHYREFIRARGVAVARLRRGYTPSLFAESVAPMEQTGLMFPADESEPGVEG